MQNTVWLISLGGCWEESGCWEKRNGSSQSVTWPLLSEDVEKSDHGGFGDVVISLKTLLLVAFLVSLNNPAWFYS